MENRAPELGYRLLYGAIAGLIAGIPMTGALATLFHLLPPQSQYRLPPQRITRKIARRVGLSEPDTETELNVATTFTHFGYSAFSGILYSLAAPFLHIPLVLRGLVSGLALWIFGYMGWLPALQLLPPPERKPAGRNALMITAHLIWGLAAAVVFDRLESGSRSKV